MKRLMILLCALCGSAGVARAEILGMKVDRAVTEQDMKDSLRDIDLVDEKGARFDLRGTLVNGKPTLVSLWAHWCPNCLAEAPGYKALAKACPDRWNVVFVSSMQKDYPRDLAKFKTFSLPWKIYRIADTTKSDPAKAKAAAAFYGVTTQGGVVTPTHYFVGPGGAVQAIVSGRINFAEPERLAAFCGS